MSHSARILLFLLSFSFLTACSTTSNQSRQRVLTRADIESLVKALDEEIEKNYDLLQHKEINRYVDELGQSIVSRNETMPPLPYRFIVLRTNEVVVFSIPGGQVYVGLGILKNLDLEGQLAAAIAHELAHQDLGHPLQVWRDRILGVYKPGIDRAVHSEDGFDQHYFGKGGLLSFDKVMEQEADENAMSLLYHAGFDPRVYIAYLQALQKIQSQKKVRNMLSMHPSLEERVRWSQNFMRNLPPKKDPKLTSSAFKAIKRKLNLAIREERRRKVKKVVE